MKFGYETINLEYELVKGGWPGFVIKAERRTQRQTYSNMRCSFATASVYGSTNFSMGYESYVQTVEVRGFVSRDGQDTTAFIPSEIASYVKEEKRIDIYRYTLGHKMGTTGVKSCKNVETNQKKSQRRMRIDCIGNRLRKKEQRR